MSIKEQLQSLGTLNEPLNLEKILEVEKQYHPYYFPAELVKFYKICDGIGNIELAETVSIDSLSESLKSKKMYVDIFEEMEEEYPKALYPLVNLNGGHLFVTLTKKRVEESPLYEWYAADGDYEISLKYDSFKRYLRTKVDQKIFLTSEGKKMDEEQQTVHLENIQKKYNPNMYDYEQDGDTSSLETKNLYEIDCLPKVWR